MESFWNVPDKVDMIRITAQWLAVISAIIALIFTMRASKLKRDADAMLNNELILTRNELDRANDRISNLITEVSSKEEEDKAFEAGAKVVIRKDLL